MTKKITVKVDILGTMAAAKAAITITGMTLIDARALGRTLYANGMYDLAEACNRLDSGKDVLVCETEANWSGTASDIKAKADALAQRIITKVAGLRPVKYTSVAELVIKEVA